MLISRALLLTQLQPKKVVKFRNPEFDDDLHYHVCLGSFEKDVIVMTCCTSKQDSISKQIKFGKYKPDSVVTIFPSQGITPKETYINCNDSFDIPLDYLIEQYENNELEIAGEVDDDMFKRVISGAINSDLISEEIKIFLKGILEKT